MIQDPDTQRLAGLLQPGRQGEILVAGRRIAARVVVDQEDGLGGILDGRAKHFAGMNQAAVQDAGADAVTADEKTRDSSSIPLAAALERMGPEEGNGMMPPHDADLVARWQLGDPAAFEELVRRWQQPMARFLFRLTGDAALTADLCQEVFLRVLAARERYRDNGRFSAWLYRIALNVARDAGRRRRFPTTDQTDRADPAAPAEEVCQKRELAVLVARAVAELPETLRIVLNLRCDEGLGFEEIARMTGVPASTLKSRFAVALARLRVRLRELGCGPEENRP